MSIAAALALEPSRAIVHRSRGRSHSNIIRLMSPNDFGRILKPFVFLDLFDNQGTDFPAVGMHPHSGLATLTYVAEGSVTYEDTNGATGVLRAGGVEWSAPARESGMPAAPGIRAARAAFSCGSPCRRISSLVRRRASTGTVNLSSME